ncbi:hypothetical protein O9929_01425 [Vibrio lentus]|nr:hypothetical protein [Vibrio lentus]
MKSFENSRRTSEKALDNMRSNSVDTTSAIKSTMAAQSGENARAALAAAENTASRSQTGSSGDISKVAIAVAAAFAIAGVAFAPKGANESVL